MKEAHLHEVEWQVEKKDAYESVQGGIHLHIVVRQVTSALANIPCKEQTARKSAEESVYEEIRVCFLQVKISDRVCLHLVDECDQ